MRITENQAGALTFAALDGHITSQEAIELGFGPATCGILENHGLLAGAGQHGEDHPHC
jgi:hypothetical protein